MNESHGNAKGGMSNAAAYARAQLVCREVREDLVALERGELSPLRAESVHHHLAGCPECREEALELDLAVRSLEKLPALAPPAGLAERTVKLVVERTGELRGDPPREGDAPAPDAAHPAVHVGGHAARPAAGKDAGEVGASVRSGSTDAASPGAGEEGWGAAPAASPGPGVADESTRETVILPRRWGFFRRPVTNPLVRAAVAAALLLGVVGLGLQGESVADVVGLVQTKLFGPRVYEAIYRATDVVLSKLPL